MGYYQLVKKASGYPTVEKYTLADRNAPLSVEQVLLRWQHDVEFARFFSASLARVPYDSFRWETPPTSASSLARPFEFVVVDCPWLAQAPDLLTFAPHFECTTAGETIATFNNLGGDATLIAPTPESAAENYSHLAAFVRGAPAAQIAALWHSVGQIMQANIGTCPVWLNTAGDGVAWLHVRLDSYPKYYHYLPYKSFDSN